MVGVYDVYIGSAWKREKKTQKCFGTYCFLIKGGSSGKGKKSKEITSSSRIETTNENIALFEGIVKACESIPSNAVKVTFHTFDGLAYRTFSGGHKLKKWRKPYYAKFTELCQRFEFIFKLHKICSAQLKAVSEKAKSLLPSFRIDYDGKLIENTPIDYYLFTDGSCNNLTEPHEGGYAYVLLDKDFNEVEIGSNGALGTTNNKMELTAIIEGCKAIKNRKAHVKVFSDSQYAINVLSRIWKATKNTELISSHFASNGSLDIEYEWVHGHSGVKYNEICDKLAGEAAQNIKEATYAETKKAPESKAKKNSKKDCLNNADYVAYALSLWDKGTASYSYIIKDKCGDLVDEKAYVYGNNEWRAALKAVVDAIHTVPECDVNVLVVTDSKYIVNIFTGKWNPKTNFDLINEQLDNERNWHIKYQLTNMNNIDMKKCKLLAMEAIAKEIKRWDMSEEKKLNNSNPFTIINPNLYEVAFKAIAETDKKAQCCYVVRLPDGGLRSNVFEHDIEMSDTKRTLENLIMVILAEAFKIIPQDADIDIYSEDCFPFLATFYEDKSDEAYRVNNYLASQIRYTDSGEKRSVRILNKRQSRLFHAIERKLG